MKKIIKRVLIIVGALLVVAFLAFLYLIPPFTLAPPETFIETGRAAGPNIEKVADPAQQAIAARGKYLVQTIGCSGCHTASGDKGPKFDTEHLAGGMKFSMPQYGTVVSRNLTPDPATGLARRSDAQVLRTLRSGVSADDGRVFSPVMMPWAEFSNMSEEERYAIVVYLRQLSPVHHKIPLLNPTSTDPFYAIYGGDYAGHQGETK